MKPDPVTLNIPIEQVAPLKPSMMEWHTYDAAPASWRWTTPGVLVMVVVFWLGLVTAACLLIYIVAAVLEAFR